MNTVSAIIPTIGRASLRAAVESILWQVDCQAEAIVVLDAPEKRTAVTTLLDGLSYTLLMTDRIGAAAARNVGLEAATGEFIGYLDDDDLWLPGKVSRQLIAVKGAPDPSRTFAVVASQFVRSDRSISRNEPRPFDPARGSFPNYLVERRSLRYGSVYFNTPALLGPSALMRSIPWDPQLRKHEDWDLMIRLMGTPGVNVQVVDKPLVRVNQGSVGSLSAGSDWRDGAILLAKHDAVITGRARADFVLLHVLLHACRSRSRPGVCRSLKLMRGTLPHAAAVVRFALGILLRR